MIPAWMIAAAGSFFAALALWLVQRAAGRIDALERDRDSMKEALHDIKLQMAKELPTKDDVREVKQHVESLAATMGEIRDMVIRLDAQHATQQR